VPTTITRASLALLALLALLFALLSGPAPVAAQEAPTAEHTEDACEEGSDDCDDEKSNGKFKDVHRNLTHYEGIEFLFASDVTHGCKPTSFCPNKPITRAEFATFVHRLSGGEDGVEPVFAPADDLTELRTAHDELAAEHAQLRQDYEALLARVEALENN
jgi:hypothetical protein